MSIIKINFQKLSPVPDGYYEVIIKNVKLKQSKSSISKYLTWHLEIFEGNFKGKTLFLTTSLSSNALWRIKNLFKAINYTCVDDLIEFDTKELLNRKLQVKVVCDVFDDKTYNEIVDFYPSVLT